MPRARNIKPSFFTNEQLAVCPFEARLLFIGLWTLADREGRLEYRPLKIKAQLMPFDNVDVASLLCHLESQDLIAIYTSSAETSVNGRSTAENGRSTAENGRSFIWVKTFLDHQQPHSNEPQSVIPPCVAETAENGRSTAENGRSTAENGRSTAENGRSPVFKQIAIRNQESGRSNQESGRSAKSFSKPAAAEVAEFAEAHGLSIDAEAFIDHYESNGWKVGKNAMKDWHAAVRNWIRNQGTFAQKARGSAHDPRGTFAAAEAFLASKGRASK